jgi:ABC-type oligopeptide transport system substrate-binding subunit
MCTINRWVRLLVMLAVFALLAAACGGDDGADTTTTSEPATTTAAPGATTTTGGEDTTQPPDEPVATGMAGLQVVDDLTFTVEFEEADPEFPLKMAYAAYFPMPTVALEDPQAFEEQPVGNGPFEMDGVWEHDVRVPLKRYEDYQGPDMPSIDSLEFTIIDDLNTAYNEVRAGNLDVLGPALPTDQIATAADEFGDRYGQSSSTSFTYLGFPLYLEDTLTLDHRRALSMAIDRDLIVEQIYAGTREPAFSTIPPIFDGARTDVCANWNYLPDEAKALWDAAGPLEEVTVWFNTGGGHEEWVEAVANMWRNTLEIDDIKFETLEFSEYLPLLDNQGATGPFRLGWGQDYPSMLNFLEPLYASYNFPPVGSNTTFWVSEEFDSLLAEGKAAVAASGQASDGIPFYQQAEDILCGEAAIAPVWFRVNQWVNTEGIGNVCFDSYSDLGTNVVTSDDGFVSIQISEPEHLFPTTSNESNGIHVLRSLFKGLVDYDYCTNQLFFAHADSITSDDGGKTWTVMLKPGWTFHNGEPVTAASYVNAWNYGADPANAQQNNSFYAGIVGYAELNPPAEE